jgi:hypothetical protein
VLLHAFELGRREATGLEQDRVRDGDLADVVEQATQPQGVEVLRRELQLVP